MDKSTKALLKKGILKKIVLQNRENELNLLTFLKKKKLILEFGTPINKIEKPRSRESEVNLNPERIGSLINIMRFCEFDKDEDGKTDLVTVNASYLDGSAAPFFAHTRDAYEMLGEMSVSTILGQWFGIVYPNGAHNEPLPMYTNRDSTFLPKKISLQIPYTHDVFVKSITEVVLPDNRDEVYYATLGNSNIGFCGVESNIDTYLSYELPGNDSVTVISQTNTFLRAVRSVGNEDVDEYDNRPQIKSLIKLPAGTQEFVFVGHLFNRVYSSKDFSILSELNSEEYGFALVDLRNKLFGKQYPIMRDPLGAWEKQPFGGAKICTTLEFYTVENDLAI